MFLKGRVHVCFIRELDVPLLGESNLMGLKKSVEVKIFHGSIFKGVPRVINDAWHAFLTLNLNSPPYMTSYHFSSYLKYFSPIYLELDHKLFFTFGQIFFFCCHVLRSVAMATF